MGVKMMLYCLHVVNAPNVRWYLNIEFDYIYNRISIEDI